MQRNSIAAIGTAVLLTLAAVSVAVAGLGTAGAASHDAQPSERTITVSSTGEASAAPDEAVVHVSVSAEAETPAEVRDGLASGAESLRAALDELGVDYETTGYDIREHRRPPDRREAGPAYEGSHRFEVSLDDPDAVGDVIDAAANANAEIDGVQLTLSEERRQQLRDEAIGNAIDDARDQAETVAAAADLSVNATLTIDASQSRYVPVRYDVAAEATAGDGAAPTTIDRGDVTVSYAVQVTYGATG